MTHRFFEATEFPWFLEEADNLYKKLCEAISEPKRIEYYYKRCREGLESLNLQQSPHLIWKEVLDKLTIAGALQKLCENLIIDPTLGSIKPTIQVVIEFNKNSRLNSRKTDDLSYQLDRKTQDDLSYQLDRKTQIEQELRELDREIKLYSNPATIPPYLNRIRADYRIALNKINNVLDQASRIFNRR